MNRLEYDWYHLLQGEKGNPRQFRRKNASEPNMAELVPVLKPNWFTMGPI
jgi:hypothetical protein